MTEKYTNYLVIALSVLLLTGCTAHRQGNAAMTPHTVVSSSEQIESTTISANGTALETITNHPELPIPPLLEDLNPATGQAEFELTVQEGQTEFIEGHPAQTFGYNGNYLGPVIRVQRGDEVKIKVINTLHEPTTVHWHGLEVDAEMDGGPHQGIAAQETW